MTGRWPAGTLLALTLLAVSACGEPGLESVRGDDTVSATPSSGNSQPDDLIEAADTVTSSIDATQEEPTTSTSRLDDLETPPADLREWRTVLGAMPGPADSFQESFFPVLGFFPDLRSPPDAGLELVAAEIDTTEYPPFIDVLNTDGLDAVRMVGRYQTTSSYEELEAWYDAAYGEGDSWELASSSRGTVGDDRIREYEFTRPAGSLSSASFAVTIRDRTGEVELNFIYREENVNTMDPHSRLATTTTELPSPFGTDAYFRQVTVDDNPAVITFSSSWFLEGATIADVADEVVSRLPANGFSLTSEPSVGDEEVFSLDPTCEDSEFCLAKIRTSFDHTAIDWTVSYRR